MTTPRRPNPRFGYRSQPYKEFAVGARVKYLPEIMPGGWIHGMKGVITHPSKEKSNGPYWGILWDPIPTVISKDMDTEPDGSIYVIESFLELI